VPALAAALADTVPIVRMRAAYALGEIGPAAEAALPKLKEAVNREKDGNARGAAVLAVDKIQGRR
jgi:HEAT repeat protein